MNPWLITIRPMVIPTEAREEMLLLSTNRSPAEISDAVWKQRAVASGPVRRSHRKNWPFKRVESNVFPLKKARRNAP